MKNILGLLKIVFLILLINGLFVFTALAQDPPPPPAHGAGGNVPGGGAPIGSGLLILTVLGAAYGTKKFLIGQKKTGKSLDTE